MLPIQFIINLRRTFEMPLINWGINLLWILSTSCSFVAFTVANQMPTLPITDSNFFVTIVTLSTQDNAKLLEQLKSGCEKQLNGINITIKW